MDLSNCTVIIRSSGERTVPVVWTLMKQKVPENQIFEVKEVPFTQALKVSYEIGIEDNREWLLIVDGDILPFRNMAEKLVKVLSGLDDRVFSLQCNMIDKMSRTIRATGGHLYRTALLPTALPLIPENRNAMRPESVTITRMERKGYPTLFIDDVLALHDYHQFYHDLFRKGFFTAHKHTPLLPYLEKLWVKLSMDDKDYEVLYEGLKRGKDYDGLVLSDVEYFKKFNVEDILAKKGITEKKPLGSADIDFDWIARECKEFEVPVEYWNYSLFSNSNNKKNNITFKRKFLQLKGSVGWLRLVPWLIGNFMEKIGRGIKRNLEL